jgi:AcrR family transcriptional regulator
MATESTALRITNAARSLLDREGADAVTMRRLAKAVNVTPMALYRHFSDHGDLLDAVADRGFEELAARLANSRLPTDPERRLKKIWEVFVDFALEKPRLFELMFLERRQGARPFPGDFRAGLSPTANVAAAALEAGIEQGVFRQDDIWEITFETGAMLQGLVMLHVSGRIGGSEEEFRKQCQRAIRRYINGIRR